MRGFFMAKRMNDLFKAIEDEDHGSHDRDRDADRKREYDEAHRLGRPNKR